MKKDLSFDEFLSVSEKDWQNKLSQELHQNSNNDKLLNYTTTSNLTFAPLYWNSSRSAELPGFVPYRRGFKASADFLQLKYNLSSAFTADELYQVISYFPNILEYDARLANINQIETAVRNIANFLRTSHAHECQYRLRVSECALTTALLDSLNCSQQVTVVLDLSLIFFNRTDNSLDLKYNLDLFVWAIKSSKRNVKLLFSGSYFDEIGSSSNLQNALVLTFFCEVFEMLTERGLSQAKIFELCEFELSCSEKTFESTAQMRSFREMLYHVFVAKQISCDDFHFPIHVVCSKTSFTTMDFWQNILRCSSVIMSSCFSNVSSVTPLSLLTRMNELSLSTDHLPSNADAIAMNSYHMLVRESHLAQVTDPFGGSFMLEDITNQMNEKTFEFLQKISHAKTFYDFFKSPDFLHLLQKTSNEEKKLVHKRKKIIAGINEYPQHWTFFNAKKDSSLLEQSYSNGESDASKPFVLKLRQVWIEKNGMFDLKDWFNLGSLFSDGMCLRQVQNIINSHAEFQFFVELNRFRSCGDLEDLRINFSMSNHNLKKAIIFVVGDEIALQPRIHFVTNLMQLFSIQSEVVTSRELILDSEQQAVILCTLDGNYQDVIQTAFSNIKKSMILVAGASDISDDQLLKYRIERIKAGMDVVDFGYKIINRFKLKD